MMFRTEPRRGEQKLAQGEGASRNPGDGEKRFGSPGRGDRGCLRVLPLSPRWGLGAFRACSPDCILVITQNF